MVNKQEQRSMKMAIRYFRDLVRFGMKGQNLGKFLENKVHLKSYQNMSITKVVLLFLHF